MEDEKKIISVRRIMEDLIKQKNDGISKELWMIKKKMGLGRIMEDLITKTKKKKRSDPLVNRSTRFTMMVFQRNYR